MSIDKPPQKSSTPSPENQAPKQPVSDCKVAANRRNASRSTGPKTKRGKRIVSRNAIKHGLLARQVVITAGMGAENEAEFHKLVDSLQTCYEPVGLIEEILVETIAVCLWRKARVIRAENGEIRKRLDTAAVDVRLRNSDKANMNLALGGMDSGLFTAEGQFGRKMSLRDRWSLMQVSQIDLRGHPAGLAYLSSLLTNAKSEIIDEGCISEITREQIFCTFCFVDYLFAITCANSGAEGSTMKDPTSGKVAFIQDERNPIDVSAYIDEWRGHIKTLMEGAISRELHAADAEAPSVSLPPADATDKLLRYEAHIDRQLYHAMDQLERLQQQRKGENVPPPLNVNLSRRA
jgi:hypothetical protein